MELFIVTGASRGLGAALACALAAQGRFLLTMSRSPAAEVAAAAKATDTRHEHWSVDLSHGEAVAARLEEWLRGHHATFTGGATLINNAGALGGVGPVESVDPAVAMAGLRIDLEAPILLTAAFLRATSGYTARRRVLQVSSGAGRNAYAGWPVYCAAKAGLDHFTRVLALDEARKPHGARVASVAPGVIDTAMQAQLRDCTEAAFPQVKRFFDLKKDGQLATPEAAAKRLLALIDRPDFGAEPVADARGT